MRYHVTKQHTAGLLRGMETAEPTDVRFETGYHDRDNEYLVTLVVDFEEKYATNLCTRCEGLGQTASASGSTVYLCLDCDGRGWTEVDFDDAVLECLDPVE
jgi:hypothetical protein